MSTPALWYVAPNAPLAGYFARLTLHTGSAGIFRAGYFETDTDALQRCVRTGFYDRVIDLGNGAIECWSGHGTSVCIDTPDPDAWLAGLSPEDNPDAATPSMTSFPSVHESAGERAVAYTAATRGNYREATFWNVKYAPYAKPRTHGPRDPGTPEMVWFIKADKHERRAILRALAPAGGSR